MIRNFERPTSTGRGFRGGGGGRGEGPPSFRGGGGPAGSGRAGGRGGIGGRMDGRGNIVGSLAVGREDVISAARGSFFGGSGRGAATGGGGGGRGGRDGPSRGRGSFRGGRGRGRGRGRMTTMHNNDNISPYGNMVHHGGDRLDMIQDDARMSRLGTYESMAHEEVRLDPYPPPPPPLPPSGSSDNMLHQPPLPPPEEHPPLPLYTTNHRNNNPMGHYPHEDTSLHSGGSNIHSVGSNHAGPIPQTVVSPPKRFSSGSPGRGTFGRGRGGMGARGRGDGGRGPQRGFQENGYIPDHSPNMDNYTMDMEINDVSEDYRQTNSFTGGRDGGFSCPGRSTFGRGDGPRTFGRGRGFRGSGRDSGRFSEQAGRGGRDATSRIGGRMARGGGRGFRAGGRDGTMEHYGRGGRGMDDQTQKYNVYGDNRGAMSSGGGGGGYASLASEEAEIGQYQSMKQVQYESYHQGSASQNEKRNIRSQPIVSNHDEPYRNMYAPSQAKSPSVKPIAKTIISREHIAQAPPSPKPQEPVHVVPPSPPPAPPSNLAIEIARLTDLTAQMEFQYAKHIQCSIEHEMIKTKIATLKELPVGIDAFREDLDMLNTALSSKETS